MALSGMNFSLHYFFVHKRWKAVFKNEEFRVYWGILILVSLFLANEVRSFYHGDLEEAFRQSLFQVVSIITATGFSSADYSQWPPMAILVIFFIMFIGASVGSTGGGIKIARHLIMFKNARRIFHRMISRHSVIQVRYNKQVVSERVILSIYSFAFIYFLTFLIGSIIMMGTGLDYKSAFSSVITTLGGIGPGLGKVGPANNFSGITDFGKYYLSFNMILGRLEILSVLAIFTPSFYKT
jgi:trk system potassium uptake protein TrkH